MAGRLIERESTQGQAVASGEIVKVVPTGRAVSLVETDLKKLFGPQAGGLPQERGFDQRGPSVVRFQEVTKTHLDGIAALFDTTVDKDADVKGPDVRTIITKPTTDKKNYMKFFRRENGKQDDDVSLDLTAIIISAQGANSIVHTRAIRANDTAGPRDIAVFLGRDSVNFVEEKVSTQETREDPPEYHITTVTREGFSTVEYNYAILRDLFMA